MVMRSSGKVVPLQYDYWQRVTHSVVVQRRRRALGMRMATELCPRSLGSLAPLYALPSELHSRTLCMDHLDN